MTAREKDKLNEEKEIAIRLQKYCAVCGRPLKIAQWAHRINKSRVNIRKYGKKVIHHRFNLVLVCSLRCNAAVSLSPAANPVPAEELVKKIREDLGNGKH